MRQSMTSNPVRLRRIPESKAACAEGGGSATAQSPCASPGQQPLLPRKSTTDNLLDIVRGMEGVARTSGAHQDVSVLERILTEKMMGKTVSAARSVLSSAQAQALDALKYSTDKVSELGEGVREVVHDPRAQVTAASAVGGAVAMGTGGAATGLVSGGLLGAACGLVPAVFTFGLSIPIGAAVGGGVGLCAGATMAGTAGLVGGGALGYKTYGKEEAPRALPQQPAE